VLTNQLTRPLSAAPQRRSAVLLAAILTLGLAACGSSSANSTTSSTTATTTATTTPPTSTTLPSLAASKADVAKAYSVLFDLANPAIAPKLAVVQDGPALRAAFTTALKSPLAKTASGASVSKVTIGQASTCKNEFLPTPCAKVVYDILSPGGKVLLPNAAGLAIYQNGRWLVARVTICTLLELENAGTVPPGCSG
jgi:hypothetical protein